jgi:hypothetical protein
MHQKDSDVQQVVTSWGCWCYYMQADMQLTICKLLGRVTCNQVHAGLHAADRIKLLGRVLNSAQQHTLSLL